MRRKKTYLISGEVGTGKKNKTKTSQGDQVCPLPYSFEKKQIIILAKGSTNINFHLPFLLLRILILFPESCRNSLPKMGNFLTFEKYLN